MEAIVGNHLRKVSIASMEQATDKEVKTILNNKNEFKEDENKNLPVGVTVFFHIYWNKHSSGNMYDSISGHTLKI